MVCVGPPPPPPPPPIVGVEWQEAEKAGEAGNVDDSFKLMEEVEALKSKKAIAQARLVMSSGGGGGGGGGSGISDEEARRMGANPSQKLRVCDVCGALLSVSDSDQCVSCAPIHFASLVCFLAPSVHTLPRTCDAMVPLHPTPFPSVGSLGTVHVVHGVI